MIQKKDCCEASMQESNSLFLESLLLPPQFAGRRVMWGRQSSDCHLSHHPAQSHRYDGLDSPAHDVLASSPDICRNEVRFKSVTHNIKQNITQSRTGESGPLVVNRNPPGHKSPAARRHCPQPGPHLGGQAHQADQFFGAMEAEDPPPAGVGLQKVRDLGDGPVDSSQNDWGTMTLEMIPGGLSEVMLSYVYVLTQVARLFILLYRFPCRIQPLSRGWEAGMRSRGRAARNERNSIRSKAIAANTSDCEFAHIRRSNPAQNAGSLTITQPARAMRL